MCVAIINKYNIGLLKNMVTLEINGLSISGCSFLYNVVVFLPFHSTFHDRLTVPGAHWTITYFLLLVTDNQWRTTCHRQCVRFAKAVANL